MTLKFNKTLLLPAIPASRSMTAKQTLIIQRRIKASGFNKVAEEALAAINSTLPTDAPSEAKRLRLLYKAVYSQQELSLFVTNSLADLGFKG